MINAVLIFRKNHREELSLMKLLFGFFPLYLLLILSESFGALSELPVQSHSPLNNEGPWGIELQHQITPLKMRVLVFPHTLKKDYRHGVPDNPKKVVFYSEGLIELSGELLGKKVSFSYDKENGILMDIDGVKEKKEGPLVLRSTESIFLFREKNPNKTHQYMGDIEVRSGEKGLHIINHLLIENYVRGVVPNEVVKNWPMDVLKVQAVAARTYAVYHGLRKKNDFFWDVDDTARYQVFTGLTHVAEKTDLAVAETSGEIMTFKNRVIKAYFHSYSGGKTSSAKKIFGEIDNEYCMENEEIFTREELLGEINPKFSWIVRWKTEEIKKLNFLKILKNNSITQKKFNNFEENINFTLKEVRDLEGFYSLKKLWVIQRERKEFLEVKEIRKLFGHSKIYSYWFYFDKNDLDSFRLSGHGWGHHVGMSQWGAYMMAKNYGYNYKDILNHYYKNISFKIMD
jgi:stage II sporulation protein D